MTLIYFSYVLCYGCHVHFILYCATIGLVLASYNKYAAHENYVIIIINIYIYIENLLSTLKWQWYSILNTVISVIIPLTLSYKMWHFLN